MGINVVMCDTYWRIGERIVQEEQRGKTRAEYGTQLLQSLATELTREFGDSYSARNLRNFRQFYLTFKDTEIWHTRVPNLTWSHFRVLLRVADEQARAWYLQEASAQQWSVRTLDRNIATQYYHRLLLSQNKEPVIREMQEKTAACQADRLEFVKNPVVAEFLGIATNSTFTESKLEQAILNHLQHFIMELGKGFAFVARQQHISTETEDYFIDLVFYNYILKCFVLVDLKTGKVNHQDIGQMDMYVRMYDDLKRNEGDNPTIGIVLGSETNSDLARYSVLHDSNQLFQAKYMLYLPTQEELQREIERETETFRLQQSDK